MPRINRKFAVKQNFPIPENELQEIEDRFQIAFPPQPADAAIYTARLNFMYGRYQICEVPKYRSA